MRRYWLLWVLDMRHSVCYAYSVRQTRRGTKMAEAPATTGAERQDDPWATLKPEGWTRAAVLNIPTKFWSDHSLRHQDREWDGPSGWPIKHGTRLTTVEFDQDELDCLVDDCETMMAYAASGEYDNDRRLLGLAQSAKRTLEIVKEAAPNA